MLIFDEIYTGLGRTGRMFACEHEGALPDILCVGKALGGGFPISAAIGTAEVMGSWGTSSGEAIHTSTFLGNPLGCAMATAALDELASGGWPERVAQKGAWLKGQLETLQEDFPQLIGCIRGRGLMLGLELITDPKTRTPDAASALALTDHCRAHGYLVLPSGVHGNVLALSPPFVITTEQLEGALEVLRAGLARQV